MNPQEQRILIYSEQSDTIEQIIQICESCESGLLRVMVCSDQEQLQTLFDHHEFALAFVDMDNDVSAAQLDRIAYKLSPKPTIAIINETSAESMLAAMRNGADSVFTQAEMAQSPAQLVYCTERQLMRSARIDEVDYLRDSLSKSLEELKADQVAAREIQERILPDTVEEIGDLHIEYAMQASLVLSGDFLDILKLRNGKVLFYLADVSGHGASSALVTVLLKNITNRVMRSYRKERSTTPENPDALLHLFNRELLLTSLGKHLTIFVGIIDQQTDTLDYAIGGHHPMPVLVEGGVARSLEGRGMPIGLFEEPSFERHQVALSDSFDLFMFSDGILEVIGGDNLSEKEQNLRTLCAQAGQTPETILGTVVADAEIQPDDIAVMMVSRR